MRNDYTSGRKEYQPSNENVIIEKVRRGRIIQRAVAQIEALKKWLRKRGLETIQLRDPGSTALGEEIRALLLSRHELNICPKAETALFMAARAQMVQEKIKPALQAGKIVLMDRYLLSTVVYQGYANDASEETIAQIWKIGAILAEGTLPDLTFILDCPVEVSEQRLNRPKDRMEQKSVEFRRKVVEGYRRATLNWRENTRGEAFLIDATQPPEQVAETIVKILEKKLQALTHESLSR